MKVGLIWMSTSDEVIYQAEEVRLESWCRQHDIKLEGTPVIHSDGRVDHWEAKCPAQPIHHKLDCASHWFYKVRIRG